MRKLLFFLLFLFTIGTPFSTVSALDLSTQYGFGRLPNGQAMTVGGAVNNLVQPAFAIAGFLVVIFFVVGAVRYIASSGDKEAVASARNMIVHAIIGFILLMFMFLFLKWFPGALGLENFNFF